MCHSFTVAFTEAEPTASETEVYEKVNTVLSKAHQILQDLKTYKGAGEQIREVGEPGGVCVCVWGGGLGRCMSGEGGLDWSGWVCARLMVVLRMCVFLALCI